MHSDEMPEHFVRTGEALAGRREFLPKSARAITAPSSNRVMSSASSRTMIISYR
jgi:hypothetical protein